MQVKFAIKYAMGGGAIKLYEQSYLTACASEECILVFL